MLVSWGYHNKLSYMWQLKTSEIDSLTVWQGHTLPRGSKGECVPCLLPPLVSGHCQHSLTCGPIISISAFMIKLIYRLLSLFSLSHIRILVIRFRAHLDIRGWCHLKILNICKDPFSITITGLGIRMWIYLLCLICAVTKPGFSLKSLQHRNSKPL